MGGLVTVILLALAILAGAQQALGAGTAPVGSAYEVTSVASVVKGPGHVAGSGTVKSEQGRFWDYVRCITGVGVPIGTAWTLAPYLPAIVSAILRTGGLPAGLPGEVAKAAGRYGQSVARACARFINS